MATGYSKGPRETSKPWCVGAVEFCRAHSARAHDALTFFPLVFGGTPVTPPVPRPVHCRVLFPGSLAPPHGPYPEEMSHLPFIPSVPASLAPPMICKGQGPFCPFVLHHGITCELWSISGTLRRLPAPWSCPVSFVPIYSSTPTSITRTKLSCFDLAGCRLPVHAVY